MLAAGFNPLRLKEIKKTDKFEPIIRIISNQFIFYTYLPIFMRIFYTFVLSLLAWQAAGQSAYTTYIGNYFASLEKEIADCEKGDCRHQLRFSLQQVNAYDTTTTKVIKCWYKTYILPDAKGLDSSFIRPLRIDTYMKNGEIEEYKIFVFEGEKLVFFWLETPFELVQYVVKNDEISDKQEFFKPLATKPEAEKELKAYQTAYEEVKKAKNISAEAQRYGTRTREWLLWQWRGY